jgi:putative transposase
LDCGSPLPLSEGEANRTKSARGLAHSKSFATTLASWTAAVLCRFFRWPPDADFRQSFVMPEPRTPWPHAPTHQLNERGTYFLTASTYLKNHHFRGKDRLRVLHRGLLRVARDFGWQLEAWAVFSNHYHFVAHSPPTAPDASNLSAMLSVLHVKTGGWLNKLDRTPGRQVWFNFRETRLTYQKSYLARLNYVHRNPVKHGLVPVANQYPWCSAAWFERTASTAMVKSIYRFKIDQLELRDDFEPAPEW